MKAKTFVEQLGFYFQKSITDLLPKIMADCI